MVNENTGEFCEGESEEHCGCMRVSTCASLSTAPGGCVEVCTNAIRHKCKTKILKIALCRALWEHTNFDLREFIQTYQQYISKNDIHDLLDTLLVTSEHETTDDECG